MKKSIIAIAILSSYSPFSVNAEQALSKEELNDIEVISVVGDFREINLNNSAASVSVLTSQDIALRNAQNLEEIIAIAPNVNFASGSQRARYYQIRGIGERSQFSEPINPSVGIIIDDVDFTGIGSVASMFDVAQTEIFRGPQGTRFGANAMAGLINISTNTPTDTFEGSARLSAGNYDSYSAGLVLSGPATDSVNYRVAAEKYQSDGFIDNTYLNKDDTNNRDEFTFRSKFAIKVSDHLNLDLGIHYFDFDNGYDAFSLDNNGNTLSDEPGFDKQETTALTSKATYTAFNGADIIGIISYADTDLAYGYDEDWSHVGLHPWEYSSTDHYFRDKSTFTSELRFVSKDSEKLFSNTTDWIAGIYYKKEEEDLTRSYTYLASDFSSDFETTTIAGYVQFDSQLSEKVSLTTGLRVENREAEYDNSDQLSFAPSDTMVGGKVVLSYQRTENAMFYGSINRGYKTGGVNIDGSIPEELREFDPEYLWNYEVGYKISLLEGKAALRFAAFYMDRNDVQVKSSQSLLRPDGSSEFITYLGNAAEGTNKGIEVDGNWYVSDDFEIYGALGLLDSEFNDFINANGEDLSGRSQAHAPEYQYHLGSNFYPTDNWLINISVEGKDKFYFSNSHDERSDNLTLVNASISYLLENWQIKIWGRNISDEEYQTRGFYFGNDPRDGYTAKSYYQNGEPAVFGLTVDYQF